MIDDIIKNVMFGFIGLYEGPPRNISSSRPPGQLRKELKGPFDFVFCDADKEWYKNYFIELEPKLEVGGCFTAHNVSASHWNGIREFLEYLEKRPFFETTIDTSSPAGISISCKKAEK